MTYHWRPDVKICEANTHAEKVELVQCLYKLLDECVGYHLDGLGSSLERIAKETGPSLEDGPFKKALGELNKCHWLTCRAASSAIRALCEQTKIGKDQLT